MSLAETCIPCGLATAAVVAESLEGPLEFLFPVLSFPLFVPMDDCPSVVFGRDGRTEEGATTVFLTTVWAGPPKEVFLWRGPAALNVPRLIICVFYFNLNPLFWRSKANRSWPKP